MQEKENVDKLGKLYLSLRFYSKVFFYKVKPDLKNIHVYKKAHCFLSCIIMVKKLPLKRRYKIGTLSSMYGNGVAYDDNIVARFINFLIYMDKKTLSHRIQGHLFTIAKVPIVLHFVLQKISRHV